MRSLKLTIGNLARQSGVGVETVRFYERKGLLRQPDRKQGAYREYDPDDLSKIRFIRRAQELGFTLREIQELLGLHSAPGATCGEIRKRGEAKIAEIDAKIADLGKMKSSLEKLKKACSGGKKAVARCRILDCLSSEEPCC